GPGTTRCRAPSPPGAQAQAAYASGGPGPVAEAVAPSGAATVEEDKNGKANTRHFDLRPGAIIRDLDLLKPIYFETARHGHFGRRIFRWEQTDRAAALRKAAGK